MSNLYNIRCCTLNASVHSTSTVWCPQVSNESTYQEVVRATCGKVTGVICEVAIAIYTFGTCIAFFIVIGDQLDRCEYIRTDSTSSRSWCCCWAPQDSAVIEECKEHQGWHHSAFFCAVNISLMWFSLTLLCRRRWQCRNVNSCLLLEVDRDLSPLSAFFWTEWMKQLWSLLNLSHVCSSLELIPSVALCSISPAASSSAPLSISYMVVTPVFLCLFYLQW